MAVAAEPAQLCASSRRWTRSASSRASTTSSPLRHTLHRRLRDAGLGVPEAARPQPGVPGVPARVRRAGPARRAATASSACARARCCAGRSATSGDPYALAAEEVARYRQAPFAGAAAVRRRRRRLLRLRPRAHGRAARRAEPRRARPARHGADAQRRARRLRPPQAHGSRSSPTSTPRTAPRSTRPTPTRWRRSQKARELLAGPVPRHGRCTRRAATSRRSSRTCRARQFEAMVARIVEYVHAGDAFQVVPVAALVGAPSTSTRSRSTAGCAHVNPSPYMYFLDFGDFQVAGAQPRAAADRQRPPRLDAPDRRHAPARRRRPRRTRASPRTCSPTRRSAPST